MDTNYIKDIKKLKIWQKANSLNQEIKLITKKFPKDYILTDQIIRSSKSIEENITNGVTQKYIKVEIMYINISLGSTGETQNHLITAHQNNYITEEELTKLDNELLELKKMMFGYLKKLKEDRDKPTPTES